MILTSCFNRGSAALLLVLTLAGCATPPAGIHPFSTAQRGAFMKHARPPEAFGLTVYRSDDGPTFAGSHRLHHGQVAVLDFIDHGNEAPPMVRVMIKGLKVPIPALVDTTSRDNWALPEMLRTLRGTPLGPPGFGRTADHVLDDIGGLLFIAPTIMLDEVQMENALFYARAALGPMGPPARWVDDPAPQLVLGANLFRSFPFVQFDLPRKRILLATSQDYQPDESRLLATLPLQEEKGALACVVLLDGKPVKALLDIAGNFELAMDKPLAAQVRQLTASDLVLRQVPIENAHDLGLGLPEAPRLGRRLLERYLITVDFRQKVVHFERPAG